MVSKSGTSIAAPEVTSIAALLQAQCGFGLMDPLALRSWMRTLAYVVNPDATRYSTPNPRSSNIDWLDGAGLVDAATMLAACGTQTPETQTPGTVSGGGKISFDPRGQTGAPPTGAQSIVSPRLEVKLHPTDYAGTGTVQRVGLRVGSAQLKVGARIRETISWHACSLDRKGIAPARVAIDYDLFLYNRSTGRYVAASQSFDDNNEGYDHFISSADGDGDYETWVVAVPGTPCGGTLTEDLAYTFIDFSP